MREIEIKLRVENFSALEDELKNQGCILSELIHQHDVIYSRGGDTKEFASAKEGDIILRIRRQGDKTEFNLKQQCSSEGDNIEYETEVKNPESLHNILNILGWKPAIEVKKIRRKGKIGNYEICLDDVEKLGKFIELELLAEEDMDPARAREELFNALEKLGLSKNDEEVRGYDTLIYQLNNKTLKS